MAGILVGHTHQVGFPQGSLKVRLKMGKNSVAKKKVITAEHLGLTDGMACGEHHPGARCERGGAGWLRVLPCMPAQKRSQGGCFPST